MMDVEKQSNGSDCGVLSIAYALWRARISKRMRRTTIIIDGLGFILFAYWLFRALALQRSSFRENRSNFLTFISR